MGKVLHGKNRSPEHRAWKNMKSRCYNKNRICYPNYGGRGITVCKEWRISFLAFLRDMGEKPTEKHSLDRINNDRGYFHGNCKWSTKREQNRNMRRNIKLTANGRAQIQADWARELGLPQSTLQSRLRVGLSMQEIYNNSTQTN